MSLLALVVLEKKGVELQRSHHALQKKIHIEKILINKKKFIGLFTLLHLLYHASSDMWLISSDFERKRRKAEVG